MVQNCYLNIHSEILRMRQVKLFSSCFLNRPTEVALQYIGKTGMIFSSLLIDFQIVGYNLVKTCQKK